LASGDEEGAKSLFKTYKKLKTATPASVLLMEAFFDFNSGNSEMARNKILKLTQYGALNHIGLSLLGKVLLKLGDFQEALKVMETANKMAPSTIDRLCDMADVYGGLGQESLLDNVIDKLKTSGSDLSRSNKTLAKHETARGNTEEAAKYIGANEEVASGVVAHMNNLGVAYAQASDLEASAKSYVDGLKTIIGKFPKLEALVQYNLALNLVRQGKLDKAMKILRSTVAKADGHLKAKAFSLYKKVKHSIETKQPLNIAVSNKPVNLGDSLGEAVRDELKGLSQVALADTGEVALFGVFKVKHDKTNNNFMEKFPNAIQKKLEKLADS
jgi:tetratricopeptide (TPR) repeat protein